MGWKEYPYWLRGGILLFAINLILFLTYLLLTGGNAKYDNPASLLALPAFLITDFLYTGANSTTAIIFFSSIFYFVIGSTIGWVINKIN